MVYKTAENPEMNSRPVGIIEPSITILDINIKYLLCNRKKLCVKCTCNVFLFSIHIKAWIFQLKNQGVKSASAKTCFGENIYLLNPVALPKPHWKTGVV